MRGSVALLLVLCAASLRAEDGVPDLSFPGKERPFRVRMEATTDGPAAWDDFIDRLFAYFDRDGDGFLNRAETARMFALPLSAGKTLPFDFARMDAEGKVSRAKFKAYCRREGFGPVFVTVGPASDEAFRLGEALFRHLDGDQDGVLTRAELEHAPALLRRLDEDDDEVLTPAEVLAVVPGDPLPTAAGTPKILAAGEGKADVVLRLNLGAEPRVLLDGESLRRLPGGRARLTVPNHVCQIELIATMPKSFDATREFYLSLFQASAGDQQWLDKKQIEDDIGLQPLAELFDVADRDGDGKLARIELEAFLDLVERGVNCRVCVTLTDRGRNLFDQLDQDGDGRLDRDELLRAAQVLGRPNTLRREDLPRQWRLTAREGAGLKSFGPVALAVAPRGAGKVTAAEARGPRWFQALDRNRRGFLTPRDFLGPLDLFQRLDRDGDGRITVEEADRATGKAP